MSVPGLGGGCGGGLLLGRVNLASAKRMDGNHGE